MWKPPERIKHELPAVRWPTRRGGGARRAGSARSRIGPLHGARSAPGCRRWCRGARPTTASSRPTCSTGTAASPTGGRACSSSRRPASATCRAGPLLRIGHDRFVAGLARARRRGARGARGGETLLFIQLIDFLAIRRRPPREQVLRALPRARATRTARRSRASRGDERWLDAPDDEVRARARRARRRRAARRCSTPRELEALERGYRERVTDVHLPHIARAAARAARRCSPTPPSARVAAGFDGVELHYAHAYTMASFLSALNTRDDGYGGSREQRVRLPLEVLARGARARRRPRRRRLPLPRRRGRSRAAAASTTRRGSASSSRAPASTSSRSRKGGKFEDAKQPKVGEAAYPYTGPSGYECMPTIDSDERGPFGRNVAARRARSARACARPASTTPIVAAGGICDVRAGRGDRSRAARPTSSRAARQIARRSRLVPEDARSAAATRSAAASSRTTARRSTSSTSR